MECVWGVINMCGLRPLSSTHLFRRGGHLARKQTEHTDAFGNVQSTRLQLAGKDLDPNRWFSGGEEG